MWQTLETKAKFIGQVMTGQAVARRIEDLDAPALTFAEVKAIASGNPLVIEKAKVDAEVMRLSRLRSEFTESQYNLRGRLRIAAEDIERLTHRISGMEADLAARIDTQGDRFRITLGPKQFTDRVEAGTALVYLVNDHKDDHLRGKPSTVVLGEIAGFKLEFRSTLADRVTLRGRSEYLANVSPSPTGFISSIEHAARCIDEHLLKGRELLARHGQDAAQLRKLGTGMFEHEERFRELQRRQAELVGLLDLARNQAAAQQAGDGQDSESAEPSESPLTPAPAETIALAKARLPRKPNAVRTLRPAQPKPGTLQSSTPLSSLPKVAPRIRLAS